MLRAPARWEAGDGVRPCRWPSLCVFHAAGPEAPHPQGLDYRGFSPSQGCGAGLSPGAFRLRPACVCISYRCWRGRDRLGRTSSGQVKVTHCSGTKKGKGGRTVGRHLPLPCLGPGGIFPFLVVA